MTLYNMPPELAKGKTKEYVKMPRWYLIHDEVEGTLFHAWVGIRELPERCKIPLFYFEQEQKPTVTDSIDPKKVFFLDGTPCEGYYLGPCHHCGNSILVHAALFISEEEFQRRHEEWPEGFETVHHCITWE